VLLVKQADRLSCLTSTDWQRLRGLIDAKEVRIVALDLPTSWSLTAPADEFTARMFAAVNAMMLDVLAAVARKDYEDRRRRQTEGIAKAKAAGLYRGRPANKARNAAISSLLSDGRSWRETWMRPDAAEPCWRRSPAIAGCSEPSRALGRQARYRRASSPAPADHHPLASFVAPGR
jgi:hypothetical protein